MSQDATPTFERPAGLLEHFHIARHRLGFDTCVIVAAKYTGGTSLDKPILFRALKNVIDEHPSLSIALLSERQEDAAFGPLQTINLESIVDFVQAGDDDLARLMELQFKKPMNTSSDSPLWRLTVASHGVVLFQFHHAMGDGRSGLIFHQSLVNALTTDSANGTEGTEGVYRAQATPQKTLSPPLDKLTDLSVSWWTLFQAIVSIIIPPSWTSSTTWTGNPVVSITVPSVMVRAIHLTPTDVSSLQKAAKAHNGSLTSAIYSLSTASLCAVIARDPTLQKFKKVSTSLPVSLRSLCGVSETTMGDLISAIQRNEAISSPPTLEDGQAITRRIRAAVPGTREIIGTLKYLGGAYEKFFQGKVGQKREGSLQVSNLGPVSIRGSKVATAQMSSWTMGPIYFAQNNGVVGHAIKANVCGAPDGSCTVCVSWSEGAVDDELAEAYVKELQGQLRQFGQGSQ